MAEKKLKNTYGSFEVVGKVHFAPDSFVNKVSNSGWEYNSINKAYIDVGNGKKVYFQAMGGHWSNKPTTMKFFDNGSSFDVSWEDRLTPEIVKDVPNFQKITIATIDSKGEKVYNDFLSWYDAFYEVKDFVKSGDFVKAKGNIKFQEYKGDVTYQLELTKLFVLNEKEQQEVEPHATFMQYAVVNKESFDKSRIKSDGEFDLLAYIFAYDSNEKKTRPFRFNFKGRVTDFGSAQDVVKFVKYLRKNEKLGDDSDIITIQLIGDIESKANSRQATLDDFGEEILEMVNDGLMTEEELLDGRTVTTDGGSSSGLYVKKIGMSQDKKSKLVTLNRTSGEYEEDDLLFVPTYKEEEVDDLDDALDDNVETGLTEDDFDDIDSMLDDLD